MTIHQNWNPVEKPYRVSWTISSAQPGCYGWRRLTEVFATEAEARAFSATKKRSTIQIAINPETWSKNGKWRAI